MNITFNSVSHGNVPASDAYITMSSANMQSDMAKTESMVEALRNAQTGECPEKLWEACKAFESFFLQMMFKELRNTVPDNSGSVFAKSNAERIFEGMLDEQVSIMAANSGGIGLAGFMFKQMAREEASVAVGALGSRARIEEEAAN
jgi:flagellar protein FlgJ